MIIFICFYLEAVYNTVMDLDLIQQEYGVSAENFVKWSIQNRSVYGFLSGVSAEIAFFDIIAKHPEIKQYRKPLDTNKTDKGDCVVDYKDTTLSIEIKSLHSGKNKIKKTQDVFGEETWTGTVELRNSRKKLVTFKDGTVLNTCLIERGEVDIYAVCVRKFTGKWDYIYCLECNIPNNKNTKLTPEQRQQCMATYATVCWPPQSPWTTSLDQILEQAYQAKQQNINQSC